MGTLLPDAFTLASGNGPHIDTSEIHDPGLRAQLDAYFDAYIDYDKAILIGQLTGEDWETYAKRVGGLRDLASRLATKLTNLAYIRKLYGQGIWTESDLRCRASAYALYCTHSVWSKTRA